MPRKTNAQTKPTQWARKSPIAAKEVVLLEPPPLATVMPLGTEFDLETPPEAAEATSELPPMPGPLPLEPVKRKPGTRPPTEASIKAESGLQMLERMLSDPLYLKNVEERMRAGKIAPQIEAFIWQRLIGRPMEASKLGDGDAPDIKIIHEFTTVADIVPK